MSLRDAIAAHLHDDDVVAMEGFTHLIPHAAGHEVIRQQKRRLTVIRLTPDMIYDQLIGAGCVSKMVFSWGGNPGVGSLHRFRDAVENDWPQPLELDEHSHADMACAYQAGAAGLPFAMLRGHLGTDLPRFNPRIKRITCPFTGEELAAVPALKPDVTVIHAQVADRAGNVLITGIQGVQKEAVMGAKRAIVTVEEVVDKLDAPFNAIVLPHWILTAVCVVPQGAHPSYAQGYYVRDNAFYTEWDSIARERASFQAWIDTYVVGTRDHAEFMAKFNAAHPRAHEGAA
jgi:glutaconate CoA-transferase subunit A